MDVSDARRLFEYDRWANRETLDALVALPSPPATSIRRFAHVLAAEATWLARLQQHAPPLPIWPNFSPTDLLAELGVIERESQRFVRGLTNAELRGRCEYSNSKGEQFANTVADIVTHVALHSAYHRGQIAADMRAHEAEPAVTDFIHAARQGYIDRR